jgi:imidazolonepropionase-like amidohydrolase
MKGNFILMVLILAFSRISAQITFPVNDIRDPQRQIILLKSGIIHPDPKTPAYSADILLVNGKILNIGNGFSIPKEAKIVDLKGQHIYPSFIDPLCDYGVPEIKKTVGPSSTNSMLSSKEGAYSWNEALKPEIKAAGLFSVKSDEAEKWREAGFGLVNTHQADGISRGSSCAVFLGDKNEHEMILKEEVSHVLSLQKGVSSQEYPGSLMGVIALLRQTYYDGIYYSTAIRNAELNISIQEWIRMQELNQIFIANDKLDILRIDKLAKEFGKNYIIKTSGNEYQRVQDIKNTNAKFIVPLKFPAAYDVEDPFNALQIDLADLKHWEMAPANAAILEKNNIPFTFTTSGLKEKKEFLTQLRKAIQYGLSQEKALYAISQGPAEWLGIGSEVGTLSPNKWANFIVVSGDLFDEKSVIVENWVKGIAYSYSKPSASAYSGNYKLQIQDKEYKLKISESGETKIYQSDTILVTSKINFNDQSISGKIQLNDKGTILFFTNKSGNDYIGNATLENGDWASVRISNLNEKTSNKTSQDSVKNSTSKDIGSVSYPFMAYGWKEKPKKETYIIKNVKVWTCESSGILENTDVAIKDGKIVNIGKNINIPVAIIIDGTGKHLTPGIIDEHSHIAISRGVNECTQSNTSEVRIGDVVNCDDVNIYRQLAGGVTTSHLLHGSCNPIGGQTALIKLRWGYSPDEMKFAPHDGFIKFALGENVKRSGGNQNARYPDSRMGVEQVYLDAFTRAKDYETKLKSEGNKVRKDLELDAMVEIMNKKRFITCHSYVQSEINMLMHVADKFNFKVNTFTHILEGFKVADKMKKHGAGASSFSDWWAYKFEVYDAIPYNGAILHEQGIVTAYNSDDAEMARRLNQEAAKAVKYGNVPEEEALKFVTLNPAKLLHIDDRVGSIKIGKDADLVLWNEHPLSVYASAEMTFVDGIKFFDKKEDLVLRDNIRAERNRLIQKLISLKKSGEKTQPYISTPKRFYHCDTVGEEGEEHHSH